MKEILPNLFEIRAQNVPENLRTYNYLLVRPGGNILLSALPFENKLDEYFDGIKSKGNLLAQFLGDRHNASSGCDDLRKACGGKIICSDIEAKAIRKKVVPDEVLPVQNHRWSEDFEIISFPGHTPGELAFLWSGSTEKCLFVGDAFVPREKGWEFYVKDKDRSVMEESLAFLKEVHFDRVFFSSFSVFGEANLKIKKEDRKSFLDSLIRALRS